MAQTSTTLLATKGHTANVASKTDISFESISGVNKIKSATTSLDAFNVRDLITISGAGQAGNNTTFTVKTKTNANELIVEETATTESASASITLDHVGFVSDKVKGDGYYSQPDGLHTVSYTLSASYPASAVIKMQGTLATTPTEDDWFDISGTSFTTDGTTTINNVSFNFTGNIVWVRAKATGVTGGTIQTVLLNN